MAGEAYCDNCGAALTGLAPAPPAPTYQPPPVQPVAPPVAPPPVVQPPVAPPPVAMAGRLVLTSTGAQVPLPQKPEIIVGREDPVSSVFPDIDLTPHGGEDAGVSRRHAKLTVRANQWLVEDLKSVNFTFVNNQKLNPGVPQPLNNGDQIRLGRVLMTFHTA